MNRNASDKKSNEENLNTKIQTKFKPKSNWRPNPHNRTLEIFQRSIKQEILKCKPKHKEHDCHAAIKFFLVHYDFIW